MAVKARYNVSLPDYVSTQIEKYADGVGASPTEYAGDILRWWYAMGCPPVTQDEAKVRSTRIQNVWKLDPNASYVIVEDPVVQDIMNQLGLPNLFGRMQEHDKIHTFIAFDDHPTHWIELHLWKGADRPDGNGLLFNATPKKSTSKEEMIDKLQTEALRIGVTKPFAFSKLPERVAKPSAHHPSKTS